MSRLHRWIRSTMAFSLFTPIVLIGLPMSPSAATTPQRATGGPATLINPPDTVQDWECHWNENLDPECWSCSWHGDNIEICDILVFKPGEGWTPATRQPQRHRVAAPRN